MPWLTWISPVTIKAEDEDTVTDANWPYEVIKKNTEPPREMTQVIYPTWEDARDALVRYQQGKIDNLQAQLEQQLVKLDSINHLKKPKL